MYARRAISPPPTRHIVCARHMVCGHGLLLQAGPRVVSMREAVYTAPTLFGLANPGVEAGWAADDEAARDGRARGRSCAGTERAQVAHRV